MLNILWLLIFAVRIFLLKYMYYKKQIKIYPVLRFMYDIISIFIADIT